MKSKVAFLEAGAGACVLQAQPLSVDEVERPEGQLGSPVEANAVLGLEAAPDPDLPADADQLRLGVLEAARGPLQTPERGVAGRVAPLIIAT